MQQRQLELPRQYTFHNSYWMKPRQPSFFWGTVHKYFDRRDWLLHYRMDKATFFEVLESIRHLIGLEDTNWRAAVTAEQRLSCCLLYMATPITQQQVASLEGISQTTVQRCVHECCRAIVSQLGPQLIKFPSTVAELQLAAQGFLQKKGIPQLVTAVDGTLVQIRRPPNVGDAYESRKKFPALNVMAACDADGLVIEVAAGHSGRCHDMRVLQESRLWDDRCHWGGQLDGVTGTGFPLAGCH